MLHGPGAVLVNQEVAMRRLHQMTDGTVKEGKEANAREIAERNRRAGWPYYREGRKFPASTTRF